MVNAQAVMSQLLLARSFTRLRATSREAA